MNFFFYNRRRKTLYRLSWWKDCRYCPLGLWRLNCLLGKYNIDLYLPKLPRSWFSAKGNQLNGFRCVFKEPDPVFCSPYSDSVAVSRGLQLCENFNEFVVIRRVIIWKRDFISSIVRLLVEIVFLKYDVAQFSVVYSRGIMKARRLVYESTWVAHFWSNGIKIFLGGPYRSWI